MRPGSAALLPVNTTSTGLLCLSVGARVHRVRSNTELSVWLLLRAHHIQLHICLCISFKIFTSSLLLKHTVFSNDILSFYDFCMTLVYFYAIYTE